MSLCFESHSYYNLSIKFTNNILLFYFWFIKQIVCLKFDSNLSQIAKGLVAELAPPHVQSAWGFMRERVRAAELTACCNYLSKKKFKSDYNPCILYIPYEKSFLIP